MSYEDEMNNKMNDEHKLSCLLSKEGANQVRKEETQRILKIMNEVTWDCNEDLLKWIRAEKKIKGEL